MNEKPIIFSTEMVQAILEDKKTQTRRLSGLEDVNAYPGSLSGEGSMGTLGYKGLVKTDYYLKPSSKREFQNHPKAFHWFLGENEQEKEINPIPVKCPYGAPGDFLWVREKWQAQNTNGQWWHEVKAEDRALWNWAWTNPVHPAYDAMPPRWLPAIHMPRMACRIILEIVDLRVERLCEISNQDAIAEGVTGYSSPYSEEGPSPRDRYSELWERINGVHSWNVNPWVWVIEFKPVENAICSLGHDMRG